MKWKMLLMFALFAVSLFIQTNEASANVREVWQIKGPNVPVKELSSSSSKTVGNIKDGEFVAVFSWKKDYAYLQGKTVKGYVHRKYLTAPTSIIKVINSKAMVVRRVPNVKTKAVATLKEKMIVEDFGAVGNGWSFIQYGNVTGYARTESLSIPTVSTTQYIIKDTPIRKTANVNLDTDTKIIKNSRVTVKTSFNGWSYISTENNDLGYVLTSALSSDAPKIPWYHNEENEKTMFMGMPYSEYLLMMLGDPYQPSIEIDISKYPAGPPLYVVEP